MNEFGRILPSDFIPQLRDPTPTLSLEGANKDYELPEIEDLDDDLSTESLIKAKGADPQVEL